MNDTQCIKDLERAMKVLVSLVYEEYPTDWSLAEIAKTYAWGPRPTPEDFAALQRVQERYALSPS